MPEETVLIQRVAVERDKDGWWVHPDMPDFVENHAALKAWIAEQHLEIQQWHMEADIDGHHPYDDGECHCLGWNPVAPAPEWFLIGISDTEDGPCVSWARRLVTPRPTNPKAACAALASTPAATAAPFPSSPCSRFSATPAQSS